MTGIAMIAAERMRVQETEGFDAKHDDTHTQAQLTAAAIAYAVVAQNQVLTVNKLDMRTIAELYYPFERRSWKPDHKNKIRNLVIAGAFIAAEIDRIQRLEEKT